MRTSKRIGFGSSVGRPIFLVGNHFTPFYRQKYCIVFTDKSQHLNTFRHCKQGRKIFSGWKRSIEKANVLYIREASEHTLVHRGYYKIKNTADGKPCAALWQDHKTKLKKSGVGAAKRPPAKNCLPAEKPCGTHRTERAPNGRPYGGWQPCRRSKGEAHTKKITHHSAFGRKHCGGLLLLITQGFAGPFCFFSPP